MSESEFDSSENSEEEEKEEEKQKRPQMSTLYTKLGVTKNTLGMKRSFQSYQPTANKPFKRPALKLNNGPLNNHNLSAVPFKMPTFIKKTNFHLGSLRPGTTLGMRRATKVKMHSLYDPNAEGAFVIYRPKITLSETEKEARMTKLGGKPPDFEVEVVVDPILAAVLRPHQKAGVQFLYDCTTGLKSENAFGCIMADEMVNIF
jgi:SNF2 family DNA or RNA helicase